MKTYKYKKRERNAPLITMEQQKFIRENLFIGDKKEIAKKLDLSENTVSYVYNGKWGNRRVVEALYKKARENKEKYYPEKQIDNLSMIVVPYGVRRELQKKFERSHPYIRKVLNGCLDCLDASSIRDMAIKKGGVEFIQKKLIK
jgi:hypothetical protein